MLSELVALAYTCGTIRLSGQNNTNMYISTENASTARRAFMFLKNLYNINTEMLVKKNFRLRKNNSYILSLPHSSKAGNVLADMHIIHGDDKCKKGINPSVYHSIIRKKCCKKAHIRGAFLGAGSISDPEKGYHLEFVTHNRHYGADLCELLNEFDLHAKIIERKSGFVVYLKEGEHIVKLLSLIGAHTALLNLENMRVYKDIRNNINRLVNCETANLTKTVTAAIRQIENIKYISDRIGICSLSPLLKDVAVARLEYPDVSLRELGQLLSPPVGKSGVNHRLRQLDILATELKERHGNETAQDN
jgi:DNA-binding protein WhiA